VKVIKYLRLWRVAMVAGPHTSVCISSPKSWAGALILTLGMGKRVARAKMHASQSVSCELVSSSTPTTAPLVTSFLALSTVMWPNQ
jgi:hypothetical protein